MIKKDKKKGPSCTVFPNKQLPLFKKKQCSLMKGDRTRTVIYTFRVLIHRKIIQHIMSSKRQSVKI